MKKIILFTGLMIIICYSGWTQSTTNLVFRIVNPRIIYDLNTTYGSNCDNLDFDLEVKADVAGSYLHALELHMTTNMAAVTDLDFILAGGWTSWYSIITYNLVNNNINLSVANSKPLNSTITAWWTQIPTTWKSVGTLRLRILDISLMENCSWLTALMTGQQKEKYFGATPGVRNYLGFTTVGTPITNLYLGRIFSAGTASWGWSQAGGTVAGSQYIDWTTAVNTSVWDTTTVSAYILNAGSKAAALRIHPGARLTIAPGADLTCTGNAEINEPKGLWIQSDASGTGSFIDNGITYPNSGSARVERYLTACDVGLPAQGCWHYVSIPVTSAFAGVFAGDYLKSFDEVTYLWSPYITYSGTPLNVMEGYAVSRPSANNSTKIFVGNLNTDSPAKSLTRTTFGYNLVGNPYPSPVDLESTDITWTNVEAKVWYYSKYGKTYKPYVVGGPQGTNPGTRYVPAMQGFFVHVPVAGAASIEIENGARTVTSDTNFYKNTQTTNDVVWLTAEGPTGMTDETVIYFRQDATVGYDDAFDCIKMYGTEDALQLYSVTSDETKVAINASAFAGINTVIPVEFSIFTGNAAGNYSLTASRFESFRSGTIITLEDKKEVKTQELTVNPVYTFNYTDGDDAARFLLHFYNPSFGINEAGKNHDLRIYSFGNDVYVKDLTGSLAKGEFFLYDLMGKKISQKPVAGISLNKYTFNLPDGYYLVRVVTNDKTYNGKVYLD